MRKTRKPKPKRKAAKGAANKRTTKGGYVEVKVGGRWRLEHRYVAQVAMGQPLKRAWVVHHINKRKKDNRAANLMVLSSARAHRQYHEGQTVKIVWDGREAAIPAPKAPKGDKVGSRILDVRPVAWRDLDWFQGDLKTTSEENLNRLKESIRRMGLIRPFMVWQDKAKGKTWILDGHQLRRALGELENEGLVIPDMAPGMFVECRDEAQAAELVLLYSSHYGDTREDGLVDFVRNKGMDLGAAQAGLRVGKLKFQEILRERFGGDPSSWLDPHIRDARPADNFTRIVLRDAVDVPKALALLNHMGVTFTLEGGSAAGDGSAAGNQETPS